MKQAFLCFLICFLVSCKQAKTEPLEVAENKPDIEAAPLESVSLASGTLYRVEQFPSQFIKPRPVDIWLPKNYSTNEKFSVLYMHDGQMLFDSTTTWNKQEWKVDEWASKLMYEKLTRNFIVVVIHNISEIRWQDLYPQKSFNYLDKIVQDSLTDISGKMDITLNGDNYLKCLVEEVKPFIDKTYSVHTDQQNTFVMGSSMGGLMSMYAISEYPEIFGGAACISTHWVGVSPVDNNPHPKAIFSYMKDHFPKAGSHKVYFDYGNLTLDAYYPQYAANVDEILKEKGFSLNDSRNLFFEGTDHSENSWNQRLNIPLEFLLSNNN